MSETRERCNARTEVYSRVVGYFRPVQQWNKGKAAEFKDRVTFKVPGDTVNPAAQEGGKHDRCEQVQGSSVETKSERNERSVGNGSD